jgi:hypothetical protein
LNTKKQQSKKFHANISSEPPQHIKNLEVIPNLANNDGSKKSKKWYRRKTRFEKICAIKDVHMTSDGIIPNRWYAP